jgi:hypothetical protein
MIKYYQSEYEYYIALFIQKITFVFKKLLITCCNI